MFDIETLKFDENGLIPAVVTDADTGRVLTLAYMNRESLKISMETGMTCFLQPLSEDALEKGRDQRQLSAHSADHGGL